MDGVHCNERLPELLISVQERGRYSKVGLPGKELGELVQNRRGNNLKGKNLTYIIIASGGSPGTITTSCV